jgi:PPK2 family polyphosphate:nucleotide phosphotransferase
LRVKPGRRVRLPRDFDPGHTGSFLKKSEAKETLALGVQMLSEFQTRLAAQDTFGLLVVFQAMDAAGKDGTIRHVMSGVNPQGVRVSSFKKPSDEELDHDYLWRAARRLPERGQIGIFNRSYYEEVLVVRVHEEILDGQKLPKRMRKGDIWKRRFMEINDWERYLVDQGFPIVKLFLNISHEEQRKRFLARIDEPEKHWKFSAADARERRYWDDYQRAFEQMLSSTSTEWAPWYVIPADHKWYMRIAASAAIINALMTIDPQWPTLSDKHQAGMAEARKELLAED